MTGIDYREGFALVHFSAGFEVLSMLLMPGIKALY